MVTPEDYGKQSVETINQQISQLKQTVSQLEQTRKTDERDREIMKFKDMIVNLEQEKPIAATGRYEVGSLVERAYSRAEGRYLRAVERAEVKVKAPEKVPTPAVTAPALTMSAETARYQKLGYTKPQAEKLAAESVRLGGVSFIPSEAQRIISRPSLFEPVVTPFPITMKPVEIPKPTLPPRVPVVGVYKPVDFPEKYKEDILTKAKDILEKTRLKEMKIELGKIAEPIAAIPFALGYEFTGIVPPEKVEVKPPVWTMEAIIPYVPGAPPKELRLERKLTPGEEAYEEIRRLDITTQMKIDDENQKNEDNILREAEEVNRGLQERINKGEDYNKIIKEAGKEEERLKKKFEGNVSKTIDKYVELSRRQKEELLKSYKERITPTIAQKIGFGFIVALPAAVPVIGPIYRAGLTARILAQEPSLIESLIREPIPTLKEAIPYAVGGVLAGMFVSGIRMAIASPKYSLSFDVSASQAIKVGKNSWRVEGIVKSALKDKTGRTMKVVDSQFISRVITSTTKKGALKSFVDTTSGTIKGNFVQFGVSPKTITKVDIGKAKGTVTLNPTQVKTVYRGTGEFELTRIGALTLEAPLGRLPTAGILTWEISPKFTALQNILVKKFGKARTQEIVRGGAKLTLREQQFVSKSVTDIYSGLEAESLMRSFGIGIGRVFEPVSLKPLEFEPLKYRPFPISKQFVKQQQIAQVSAQASAQAIASQIGGKILKEAVRTDITKAVSIASLKELSVVGLGKYDREMSKQITGQVLTQPQLVKQEKRLISNLFQLEAVKVRERERFKFFQPQIQPLTQAQIQRQAQKQVQRLAQLFAPVAPAIPITPRPITPVIPPFYLPKKETQQQRKARLKEEKKAKERAKAYAASVAAFQLGLYAEPEDIKKLGKRLTGLEIRRIPIERKKETKNESYTKQLNRIFS